jgi:hypothetical protein
VQELGLLSAYANAVGSAGAMPILCRILAQQGFLTANDIEALRHAALFGYDKVREQPGFPAELAPQLEEARKVADAMWQHVALTLDKQAPQPSGPRAAVSGKARRTKVPK